VKGRETQNLVLPDARSPVREENRDRRWKREEIEFGIPSLVILNKKGVVKGEHGNDQRKESQSEKKMAPLGEEGVDQKKERNLAQEGD